MVLWEEITSLLSGGVLYMRELDLLLNMLWWCSVRTLQPVTAAFDLCVGLLGVGAVCSPVTYLTVNHWVSHNARLLCL